MIHYYSSFVEGNYLVIIMEYVDGGDLSQLIQKMKSRNKFIKEGELYLLMKTLL